MSRPPVAPPGGAPGQGDRPRRRSLRPLRLLLVLAALVVGLLAAHSDLPERYARRQLAAAAGRAGLVLSVDHLEVGVLPPTLDLEGVCLARTGGGEDTEVLRLASATARLSPLRLVLGQVFLAELDLVRPRVRWHRSSGDGAAGDATATEPAGGGSPLRLQVGRLEVVDGELEVPRGTLPVSGSVQGVWLRADRAVGGGETRFRLRAGPARVEIPGHWQGEIVHLDARGRLRGAGASLEQVRIRGPGIRLDLVGGGRWDAGPEWIFTGDAELAASAWGPLLPEGLAAGAPLEWEGEIRGRGRSISTEGRFATAELRTPWGTAHALAGKLRWDPAGLRVEGAVGVLGGRVEGDYRRHREGGALRNEADLVLAGLSLGDLLEAAGDIRAGEAWIDGRARLEWQGADWRGVEVRGDLALRQAPGSDLPPLRGGAAVELRQGRLAVRAGVLEGQGFRLALEGEASRREATARVRLEADDVALLSRLYVAPILDRMAPGIAHPDLEGDLVLEGDLSGGAGGWSADLAVAGIDMAWSGIPLGAVMGRLTADPGAIRAVELNLEGPSGEWEVAGSWPLQRGGAGALEVRVRGGDLGLLAAALGEAEVSVEGVMRGNLHLRTEAGHLSGAAEMAAGPGRLGAVPFVSAAASATIDGDTLQPVAARLSFREGELHATGAVHRGPPARWDLDLSGDAVELAALLPGVPVPPPLRSALSFRAKLDGPLPQPRLTGRAELQGPEGGGPLSGLAGEIRADAAGAALDLGSRDGARELRGDVTWAGGFPCRLAWRWDGLDLAQLGRWAPDLPAARALGGSLDGSGALWGPLARPGELRATAALHRLEAEARGLRLRSDGEVQASWDENGLEVSPARLLGERTNLTLQGRMARGARAARGRAVGTLNLALLALLDPDLQTSGDLALDLRAVAEGGSTQVEGRFDLQGGSLGYAGFPARLEAVSGQGALVDGTLELTGLTGTLGGGAVRGSGEVRFRGLEVASLDLEINGADARMEYPPGLRSLANFRLRLNEAAEGYLLSGDVDVIRGVYRLPFDEPAGLGFRRQRLSLGAAGAEVPEASAGERVRLAVGITAPDSLLLRNRIANLPARADLQLEGTVAAPQLGGTITILEGGRVDYRDVRYRVTSGQVQFASYGEIDPAFHIEAVTSVNTYDVFLTIDGRLGDFTFALQSYPPLTQEEIVVLLVTGRSPEDLAGEGAIAFGREEAAEYLYAPLSEALGGEIARALGLTRVTLEPNEDTANPSPRVSLEKEIQEDLRFKVASDFQSAESQLYQVEYDISSRFSLTGTAAGDGGMGTDFRYTTRAYSYRPRPDEAGLGRRTVAAVELTGGVPGREKKLRRLLRPSRGQSYRRALAADAADRVRDRLLRWGYLLARVEVEETPGPQPETVDLRFRIDAGQRYRLEVNGVKLGRRRRAALMEAFGDVISGLDLAAAAEETLVATLRSRGHYLAEAVATPVPPGADGEAVLRLDVAPGPRVRVGSVAIRGVEAFPEARVRQQMLTRPAGGFRRGSLRAGVLQEDLQAIAALYRAHGYQSVQVGPAEVRLDGAGGRAEVEVPVTEGPQWTVGEIRFEGNRIFTAEQLAEPLSLHPGDPITRLALGGSRTEIQRRYDRLGFDQARVTWELPGEDAAARTVLFRIEEGAQHRVGSIDVQGNRHTRGKVIWRELELDEGDPLSREQLLETQRRLSGLGIFSGVEIRADGAPGETDREVEVVVREAPNLTLTLGAGYDTEEGPRGIFTIWDNNFLGRGQRLGGVLRGSAIDRRAQITFLEPRLFGRRIEGLLSAFYAEREEISFDERRTGVTVEGARRAGGRTYLARYRLEDVALSNVQLVTPEDRVEDVQLGSVGGAVIRDRRDDPFNPRQGMFYSMDLALFAGPLASERDFARFFGQISFFRPVLGRAVWAQALRLGLSEPFRGSSIPVSERFFAGGQNTLRGFERDRVGPLDPVTDNPTGGEAQLILNQELRFPIWGALGGVVFLDVGNVYADIPDILHDGIRSVAGLGFHFRTPIGPVRLEYGWKLDREPEESRGELYLSIGYPF